MIQMKKSLKKGGVGDVVTIIIIIGLALALIVGAVIPAIKDSQESAANVQTDMGTVDDFIASGETIKAIIQDLDSQLGVSCRPSNKYDMLCVSNSIEAKALKKNSCADYRKWKKICSRFEYVVCCPKPEWYDSV